MGPEARQEVLGVAGRMSLIDKGCSEPVIAPWAGSVLALGARLARQGCPAADRRMIVAITVPARDLAAVLIAAGWLLARPVPAMPDGREIFASMERGTPVRFVSGWTLKIAKFWNLVTDPKGRQLVNLGGTWWPLDRLAQAAAAPGADDRIGQAMTIPRPGAWVSTVGKAGSWKQEHLCSGCDVVIVGTRAWLVEEMEVSAGREGVQEHDRLRDLVRPDEDRLPSWRTRIVPTAGFDPEDVPPEAPLTILDGQTAIGWLSAVESDFTVAIIDRSAEQEFAADSVMQLRSMLGEPTELQALGWPVQPGLEALAFEVPR